MRMYAARWPALYQSVCSRRGHLEAKSACSSRTQFTNVYVAEMFEHVCSFKRGYKNVINKGIELNKGGEHCELMMETSGHGALKQNHYLDDGAYMAVKIIIEAARRRHQGKPGIRCACAHSWCDIVAWMQSGVMAMRMCCFSTGSATTLASCGVFCSERSVRVQEHVW